MDFMTSEIVILLLLDDVDNPVFLNKFVITFENKNMKIYVLNISKMLLRGTSLTSS